MPQTTAIQISIINASTVLTDTEIRPVVNALQQQVTNDFRPAWGIDAELTFVPTGSTPPIGTWWLTILDDSDQAGALGYHDLTPDGLPLGKVFAATDLKYGNSWTVTASHELLEMLADPNINLTVFVQNENTTGTSLSPTKFATPASPTPLPTRSATCWSPTLCFPPGSRIFGPRDRPSSTRPTTSQNPWNWSLGATSECSA